MTEKTSCKVLEVRKNIPNILAVEIEAKGNSLDFVVKKEKLGEDSKYLLPGKDIIVESTSQLNLFSNTNLVALYLPGSEKSFYSW